MATITGGIYHAFAYGAVDSSISFFEVGAVAAGIFVLPNIFRGEYALPNYYSFRSHVRRSLLLVARDVSVPAGDRLRAEDDRHLFARRHDPVLRRRLPGAHAARYALVRPSWREASIGLVTAQRVFLLGASSRHHPVPAPASAVESRAAHRRHRPAHRRSRPTRARSISAAHAAGRSRPGDRCRAPLAPDAVFIIVPWSGQRDDRSLRRGAAHDSGRDPSRSGAHPRPLRERADRPSSAGSPACS